MRLLLDEHINPEVARQLHRRGGDAIALSEARMTGANDEQVLEFAAAANRAVVTYNICDFQYLLLEWYRQAKHHSGIIFVSEKSIPQRQASTLAKALQKLLKAYPGDLTDSALFLSARS